MDGCLRMLGVLLRVIEFPRFPCGVLCSLRAVKHSPDGRWIITGDLSGVVNIWDLTAGKLVKVFVATVLRCADSIAICAFFPSDV